MKYTKSGLLKNPKFHLVVIVFLQTFLVWYCFNEFFSVSNYKLFNDSHDTIKNYFTLQSYVTQPDSLGYITYKGMNYPFGDVVWYTDNTPLFATVIRWFHINIGDMSACAIPIFHWTLFIGIVISSVFNYLVFGELKVSPVLSVPLSIVISWINPQFIRITSHLNLAYIFLLPAAVFITIKLLNSSTEKGKIYALSLFILICLASLIHLYYLVILTVFLTTTFIFHFLFCFKAPYGFRKPLAGVLVTLLSFIVIYIIIYFTDPYFDIRPGKAGGYNWEVWKINTEDLLTPYSFLKLKIFEPHKEWYLERFSFLGYGILMSSIIILLILITARWRKKIGNLLKLIWERKVIFSLLFGGLICLFVSMGNQILIPFTELKITNIFNPFYYFGMITDSVTHFRCLGRFVWPFFFVFSYFVVYMLDISVKSLKHRIVGSMILIFVIVIFLMETSWYLDFYKKIAFDNPLNDKKAIIQLDKKKYQAIFPIPFFHVGNEDYSYTIDDRNKWATKVFNASINLSLPIMASKMSRTPRIFSASFYNMISDKKPDPILSDKLIPGKPILLMYTADRKYYQTNSEFARELNKLSTDLIKNNSSLKYLGVKNGVEWYEWNWWLAN